MFVIVRDGGDTFSLHEAELVVKSYIRIFTGIGCSMLQISVSAIDKTNNSDGLVRQHAQACSSYERIVSQRDRSESASQQGHGFRRDIWGIVN